MHQSGTFSDCKAKVLTKSLEFLCLAASLKERLPPRELPEIWAIIDTGTYSTSLSPASDYS